MAQNITQINTAADTFQVLVDRVNQLANAVSLTVVTANADANGSLTTGNAHVNGVISAIRLSTPELKGGNTQSAAELAVTTNVYFGNSTVNVGVREGAVLIGNSTINLALNSTILTFSANLSVNSSVFKVGNSSVNTTINSTLLATDFATFKSNVSIGANLLINTSAVLIGNSTVNTVANSSVITTGQIDLGTAINVGANVHLTTTNFVIGNSTVNVFVNSTVLDLGNAVLNSTAVRVGNSTVNSVVNSTSLVTSRADFSTAANVGANVHLTTAGLDIGNTTVNTTVNSSVIATGGVNVGANVQLTTGSLKIGNTTVNALLNSTHLVIGPTVINSTGTTSGETFVVNTEITVGNSTVNVFINTSSLTVGGNAKILSSSFSVGNATINSSMNSSVINTGTINLTTGANVGANVSLNTIAIKVNGTSSNTVVDNNGIVVANSTWSSELNRIRLYVTDGDNYSNVARAEIKVANAAGYISELSRLALKITDGIDPTINASYERNQTTITNSTVSTIISRNNINVGSNVYLSTANLSIGNSTVKSFANSTHFSVADTAANTVVNSAGIWFFGPSTNVRMFDFGFSQVDGLLGTINVGGGALKIAAGSSNLVVNTAGVFRSSVSLAPRTNFLSANVDLTTTTFTSILTQPESIATSKNYWFRVVAHIQASASGGFKLRMQGTALGNVIYHVTAMITDTAAPSAGPVDRQRFEVLAGTGFLEAGTGVQSQWYVTIEGTLQANSTSGTTLFLTGAQETASGTTKFLAGSSYTLQEMY